MTTYPHMIRRQKTYFDSVHKVNTIFRACLSIHPSIHPAGWLFNYATVCLSIHLHICPFDNPTIHLTIHIYLVSIPTIRPSNTSPLPEISAQCLLASPDFNVGTLSGSVLTNAGGAI